MATALKRSLESRSAAASVFKVISIFQDILLVNPSQKTRHETPEEKRKFKDYFYIMKA